VIQKFRGVVPFFAFVLLIPWQCFVPVLINSLGLVFHYCLKQQCSTTSRDKPGTSDATDADINKREVLWRQSRQIIYNVYTFLKKLSSDDERAKTHFSKTRELTVQACGTVQAVYKQYRGFVARLRCQFDKEVYRYLRLLERSIICRSGLRTQTTLRKMFYVELFSDFMTVENFPRQRNSLFKWETK
jgi:hypothetical protein